MLGRKKGNKKNISPLHQTFCRQEENILVRGCGLPSTVYTLRPEMRRRNRTGRLYRANAMDIVSATEEEDDDERDREYNAAVNTESQG